MKGTPVAEPGSPAAGVMHLRALGTTVTVAVDRVDAMEVAEVVLRHELEAIDRACSRFRGDSELYDLYAGGGRPVQVGALLFEAVSVACAVAQDTGGAVDPTVGRAVEALGYDRDFADVPSRRASRHTAPIPAPGWWCIDLDEEARSIAVPTGVRLDLGATAKALVADRAARHRVGHRCRGPGLCGWRCGRGGRCTRRRMAGRDRAEQHRTFQERSRGISHGGWPRQLEYRRAVLAPGGPACASHRRSGHR